MRFYNVDIQGKFWSQRGTSEPAGTTIADRGRLFFGYTNDYLSVRNSAGWSQIWDDSNLEELAAEIVGDPATIDELGAVFLRKDKDDSTLFKITAQRLETTGSVIIGTSLNVVGGTSLFGDGITGTTIGLSGYINAGTNVIAGEGLYVNGAGVAEVLGNTMWHAGNDGSGSGLDADLLDAQHGSYYRNAGNLNAGTIPSGRLTGSYAISITGTATSARYA